jgi:ketosteroid isomerase-like protein
MSEENIDVIRRHYEGFNRGDLDALMETVAPDAEFVNEALGETYRGHGEIRRFFEGLWEVVEDYRVQPEEFIEGGDQIVVPVRLSGRFRHTGISEELPIPARMAHAFTVRNGKILANRVCRHKDEALEAAGLSE